MFAPTIGLQVEREGFQAALAVDGIVLIVTFDPNPNRLQNAEGKKFLAIIAPGVPLDLQTDLGPDVRFDAWCECFREVDPRVDQTARFTDPGGVIYKVARYERNANQTTNRYFLVQVEAADQTIPGQPLP